MSAGVRAWAVVVVTFVAQLGCAKASGYENGGSRDVITEEQVGALHASTVYEVVSRLRGDYLHSRGRESLDPNVPPIPAHVFVDDTYYGDIDTLRNIPASDVGELRFFTSYEAQYKFGSGHMGGVVQVITKR